MRTWSRTFDLASSSWMASTLDHPMYGSFREAHAWLRCMVGLMVWSIPKVSCVRIFGCPRFTLFMEA